MSALACAGCAHSLVAGATGHGTYRLRTSQRTVAACSPQCASVGALFELIGMPAEKRTSSVAELENPVSKQHMVHLNGQRQLDRKRAVRWRYLLTNAMHDMENYDTSLTSRNLKESLLPIATQMQVSKVDMHKLLDPVIQAIDELLLQIENPPTPYDMNSVPQLARRLIERVQRSEMTEHLVRRGALYPGSMLAHPQFPVDIRDLTARFLHEQSLEPVAEISFAGRINVATIGTSYIYMSDDDWFEKIDVTTFSGNHVKSIMNPTRASVLFEPPDVRSTGELWGLREGFPGESRDANAFFIMLGKKDDSVDTSSSKYETDWPESKRFTIDNSTAEVFVGNVDRPHRPYNKIRKYFLSRDGPSENIETYKIPGHIFGQNQMAAFHRDGAAISGKLLLYRVSSLLQELLVIAIIDLATQTYRRYYMNRGTIGNFKLIGPLHVAFISHNLFDVDDSYLITIVRIDTIPSTGPYELLGNEVIDNEPPIILDINQHGQTRKIRNAVFLKSFTNVDRLHVVDRSTGTVEKTSVRTFLLE